MNLYKITAHVGHDDTYGRVLCVWFVRANDPTAAQERLLRQERPVIIAVMSIEPIAEYID